MSAVAGRRPDAATRGRDDDATDVVVDVLAEHGPALLALARRYSLCADDASDAFQRATEIFLRRAGSLEPSTRVSWLRTVVKHEAMAVRAERQKHVSAGEPELDLHESSAPDAEERVARFDRLQRAAEALGRLKPQEVRALLLKAEGHSYGEICDITGWTYTKVNRCLTEGRRAFRARYATIESGEECERWGPVLSRMADGEADSEDLMAVRPHLRGCPACRATLRDFHHAPRGLAALLPAGALVVPAIAVASGSGTGRMPGVAAMFARAHEAILGASPVKVSAAVDASSAGKVAAVAASTVAIAGGGLAAVDHRVRDAILPAALTAKVAHATPKKASAKEKLALKELDANPGPAGPTPPVVDRTPEPAPAPKPTPASTSQPVSSGSSGSSVGSSTPVARPVVPTSTAPPAEFEPTAPATATSGSGGSSGSSGGEFSAPPPPPVARSSAPSGGSAPNEFGP